MRSCNSLQSQISALPDLGTRIDGNILGRIILPSYIYEMVHEKELCYCILCIANSGQRVMGFKELFQRIQDYLREDIIPAYYAVEHGSIASWFVIYVRKTVLVNAMIR